MRVQELKTTGKAGIMGKKKHKLRKQAKENELCPSDSSDEGTNSGRCPHLTKAINFNSLRKALKQVGIVGECTACGGSVSSHGVDSRPDDSLGGATGGAGELIFDEAELTVWTCLQCGHQGCDRNSKDQHALKHFQTPRSNSHAVAVNTSSWAVWCYSCDDEVNPDSCRKLQECLEFIKKQAGLSTGITASCAAQPGTVKRTGSFKGDSQAVVETASQDTRITEAQPSKPKPISLQAAASLTQGLPKVKGLSNLGNTCFFNAVMQNLSQTYVLESLLTERGAKGVNITLPGRKYDGEAVEEGGAASDSSAGSDEEGECKNMELPSCSISLGEPGALTQSLVSFVRDMHNPTKSGTISPNNLFGQVCKKAPRFKGFQQQDSHELLRHLLDGMKAEEIKRAQASILKQFHLSENTNPKKVDEETKLKVKEYGRQAKHTFVDNIFGGSFISTVQCEECHVPSQISEPFLDISLPILEEKTVRPNSLWSFRKKEEAGEDKSVEEITSQAESSISKHQMKKSKRQAQKGAKRKTKPQRSPSVEDESETGPKEENKDGVKNEGNDEEQRKTNGDSRSQSDGEISDADVEDNIESDVARTRFLRMNSHEDDDKTGSPPDNKCSLIRGESSSSISTCSGSHRVERSDSAGRSEESTLTETSAGESKPGCSSCNSIASLSDSTCKASSAPESPMGSNTGLNQVTDSISEVTEGLRNIDLHSGTINPVMKLSKESRSSDQGSSLSISLNGTEETASTSSNNQRSSQRSKSSGYSSGTTSKSASSAATMHAQLQLEAKFKAMGSLAPRYQPMSQECSIRSCLNQFTSAELLTGSNKFGCETCSKKKHGKKEKDTVYCNASKQVLVFQPPAILTLHLKRFQQVGFTLRKVNRHVEFPMVLDLAPYCSSLCKGVKSGQTKVLYSLFGVVEHSGRLTGGHYTAYVKVRHRSNKLRDFIQSYDPSSCKLGRLLGILNASQGEGNETEQAEAETVAPPPGKWYYISDSRVNEVGNEASVLRCQAYILFYERIH